MAGSSDAGRPETDLARVGLNLAYELGNCFGRNRWIGHHHEREADNAGDGRDVAKKIEIELVVECRVARALGPLSGSPQDRTLWVAQLEFRRALLRAVSCQQFRRRDGIDPDSLGHTRRILRSRDTLDLGKLLACVRPTPRY